MKKKQHESDKLFEFRIKYNASPEHVAIDNYHYYMAHDAQEAMSFHNFMIKSHNITVQTLSVEKFNPYSERWELIFDVNN